MEKKDVTRGQELDVFVLIKLYLRHIWLILLFGACSGAIIAYYSLVLTPNHYTASAMMYVYSNNPNHTNYQYMDQTILNSATRLMQTYMVVIRSNKVMDAVSARLGYEYDAAFIANSISVGSVAGTEVMLIRATTTDPQLSMDICNAVAEYAPTEIVRVVNAGLVEVIDYASLPEYPDSRGGVRNVLVAVSVSIVLACAILTIWHMRDRRVKTDTDLSEYFDYPMLAAVPKPSRFGRVKSRSAAHQNDQTCQTVAKGKLGRFIISEDTQSNIVEIYKRLRTGITNALRGTENKVILISSSIPSEGKSVVSANLAIVAAQESGRVLLIDADLRKPIQYKLFGQEVGARGLTDVLIGRNRFEEVVLRSVRPGLDLLRAGSLPPNPIELLSSDAMKGLITRLRNEFEWIILDTPPVNVVADALVLSGLANRMVMIARREVSHLYQIKAAVQAIERADMLVLGFVLTDVRGKQPGLYYGYPHYGSYSLGYRSNLKDYVPVNRAENEPDYENERRTRRMAGVRHADKRDVY